jgi:ElaB/YqjD/DUF883 family membrane-anchored ribosome-binding protein
MTDLHDETREEPGLVEQASARAQGAASAAQDKAGELREQGTARLRDQLDRRSTDAGTQARALAETLRRSSEELRTQSKGNVADLADQLAQRIEQVATYLERKRGDEMLRDVESFARRRPWMLAGLGLLAGIAASRFVKASSEQRHGGYPARPQVTAAGSGAGSRALDAPLARDPDGGDV